jgi:hypothetical protein
MGRAERLSGTRTRPKSMRSRSIAALTMISAHEAVLTDYGALASGPSSIRNATASCTR